MGSAPLKFTLLPETFAVCRLDPAATTPAWAGVGPFVSITRTADELSVICAAAAVPGGIVVAPG